MRSKKKLSKDFIKKAMEIKKIHDNTGTAPNFLIMKTIISNLKVLQTKKKLKNLITLGLFLKM